MMTLTPCAFRHPSGYIPCCLSTCVKVSARPQQWLWQSGALSLSGTIVQWFRRYLPQLAGVGESHRLANHWRDVAGGYELAASVTMPSQVQPCGTQPSVFLACTFRWPVMVSTDIYASSVCQDGSSLTIIVLFAKHASSPRACHSFCSRTFGRCSTIVRHRLIWRGSATFFPTRRRVSGDCEELLPCLARGRADKCTVGIGIRARQHAEYWDC